MVLPSLRAHRLPDSPYNTWTSGTGGGGIFHGGGGSSGYEEPIGGGDDEVGNDDGDDWDLDDPELPGDTDPPPWPGDDDEDEDTPGSGLSGGSGGGGGGSGSSPPPGGGDPPSSYNGFLWGGSSEVFINGIGTSDSSWKSDLLRPGDSAGPLAASPDRTVIPATGRSLEEVTDLVVELPGRDFVLTRNFIGKSELMRRSSFGPLDLGGWSLSTDATVIADLVEVKEPFREQSDDKWRRMGICILMQSPLRTTIGFHNFYNYKAEAVWYNSAGNAFAPPPATLQPEQFRTFRPMGPGLCRVVADKLTFRNPFTGTGGHQLGVESEVTLPVWKLVEPGKGTSYFFRKCESSISCINMANQSGGFDATAGYTTSLLNRVPAGKLWCQFDEFGNTWSFEYVELDVTSGKTQRLKSIYLHGIDRPSCIAHVSFLWGLGKDPDDSLAGSGIWHIKRVVVDRPYTTGEDETWLNTDIIDYHYQADANLLINAVDEEYDPTPLSFSPDDLVMVVKRTGVNLPMSLETRDPPGEGENFWNTQATLYRYSWSGTESQLKAVFSPNQIDILAREGWKVSGGDTLLDIGADIYPSTSAQLASPIDQTGWGLMTLSDIDLIAPASGPPLKVWQSADRWTTYYRQPRTWPEDTGSPSPGDDFAQFKGRVMTEFLKPAGGGPTLRRDFEYASDEENRADYQGRKRTAKVWPTGASAATTFNHSYLLRSSIQRVTESTRRTDDALPSSGTLWDRDNWTPRRRTTNRSEERELLAFMFEQQFGSSPKSSHTQSLVSAVPFTVAELVEDFSLDGEGEPVVSRKWLTTHEFDAYNRPWRTTDPGAFTTGYPDEDTSGATFITCRLKDWLSYAAGADSSATGSISSTIYQDHDPEETTDAVGPTAAFQTLLATTGTGSYTASGASKEFRQNYPSTMRVRKQLMGGDLLRIESSLGTLGFFGEFTFADDIKRPDLTAAEFQSRDGTDVAFADVDTSGNQPLFEKTSYAYTSASSSTLNTRLGYPTINSVAVSRELEPIAENGREDDTVATEYVFFDGKGRVIARQRPTGTATAYVYDSEATGTDIVGRAVEVQENVDLDANTETGVVASITTLGNATLTLKERFDVSGNKLSVTTPDGVQTSRQYEVLADPEGSPSIPTVRSTSLPVKFSSTKFSGPVSCQWLNSAGQPLRVVSYRTTSLSLDGDSGIATAWTGSQELSRTETDYLLTGDAAGERSWEFASTEGVFPTTVPGQDDDRSTPYQTRQVYDGDGSVVESEDALGNITRNTYDARSRLIAVRKTVTGQSQDWLAEERFYDNETSLREATGPGLLTRVNTYTDDEATVALSRQVRNWYDARHRLVASASVSDWDTPVAVTPLSVTLYDNLDRPVLTATVSTGDASIDWTTADEGDVLGAEAIAVKRTSYSQRGLAYRTETRLDGSIWQQTNSWFDDDGRELATRTQGTPMVRREYDPHGRVVTEAQYAADHPSDWETATNLDDGFMLSRTDNTYYTGKSSLALMAISQRTHTTVPASGSLADVFTAASTSKCVTTYTGYAHDAASRVIATINYGSNNSAGFTSIGASAPTPLSFGQSDDPATALSGLSGTVLVARSHYNAQGLVDVASRVKDLSTGAREDTKTWYDSMGRVVAVSENDKGSLTEDAPMAWSGTAQRWSFTRTGTWQADENRVTSKAYDAAGNVLQHIAHMQESGVEKVQVTTFRYHWDATLDGASTDTPSPTPTHGLLYQINYPIAGGTSAGDPSTDPVDTVHHGYNLAGEQTASRDQNGTARSFIRDPAGRMIADRVTTFGSTTTSSDNQHLSSAVDSTVSQIITKYDGLGRVAAAISCLNPDPGAYDPGDNLDPEDTTSSLIADALVQNFVEYEYDGPAGAMSLVRQSAEGPLPSVDDVRCRELRYDYDVNTTSAGFSYYRLASVTYPDATPGTLADDVVYEYLYNGSPVDDCINRVSALKIASDSLPLVKYSRLGVGTTAVTDFPQIGVQLDRTVDAPSSGSTGNRDYDPTGGSVSHENYGGWDRFGRLVRNSWVTSEFGGNTRKPVWQETYTYDTLSRKTERDNTRGVYDYKDEDWKFTYDGLGRVTKSERGVLSGGSITTPSTGLPVREWTLDTLGNWKEMKSKRPPTLTQTETRSHTATNEIKNIGSIYRFYDADGNFVKAAGSSDGSTNPVQTLVYDAWNRLVSIVKLKQAPSDFDSVTYTYNALNWCVREISNPADPASGPVPPDDWRWKFYSPQWQQLLEVTTTAATSSTPASYDPGDCGLEHQFWGQRGVDDAIMRRIDANGDGDITDAGDKGYFQLTDALFSVVCHVDSTSGLVRQWMSYDAYGTPKILRTGDWDGNGSVTTSDATAFNAAFSSSPPPDSCDVNGDGVIDFVDYLEYSSMYNESTTTEPDEIRIGFAGYVRDPLTKHCLARARWYEPSAGRWLSRDPAGYVDGLSLYLYVKGNPLSMVDPTGLEGYWTDFWEGAKSLASGNPGGLWTIKSRWEMENQIARQARNAVLPDNASFKAAKSQSDYVRNQRTDLANRSKEIGNGLELAVRTAMPVGDTAAGVADFASDPSVKGGLVVGGSLIVGGAALHATMSAERRLAGMADGLGEVTAKTVAEMSAAERRAHYLEKGVPASQLGPSGYPKVHVVEKPTLKQAEEAARNAGGSAPEKNTQDVGQPTHFHAVDEAGNKLKGAKNVHYQKRGG